MLLLKNVVLILGQNDKTYYGIGIGRLIPAKIHNKTPNKPIEKSKTQIGMTLQASKITALITFKFSPIATDFSALLF